MTNVPIARNSMALDTGEVGHTAAARPRKDVEHVFHELTRSICPHCRKVIDGKILLRDDKVYMSKRCPDCGPFMALVYSDAKAYTSFAPYNKPGTIPLAYGTDVERGCPHDCGLCPDHEQHACLGIIEVNSACDMDCPLCFADAAPGFSLTLEEVEQMLDDYVRTEGRPEVVQLSGGEPTMHPRIIDFIRAAQARGIRFVMLNTNGRRIARDDRFLDQLNEVRPALKSPLSIGYLSPIEYERRHAVNPDAHQPAAVLAAVKDKPSGRPRSGAVLDRRCARRPHQRAGRDGRMAPPGAEQKNDTKQEGKMSSDQIP
jgi:Radical SAM superfamily/4Fe-4S single cluster domain